MPQEAIYSSSRPQELQPIVTDSLDQFGRERVAHFSRDLTDGTDFEGYLLSSGFATLVENAVCELDGAGAVEEWIKKKDGTFAGRVKTEDPPCPSCKQPIYADVLRDYASPGGRVKALQDILDSSKPKYAPQIASKLCEIDVEALPPKILDLFEKIKAEVVL